MQVVVAVLLLAALLVAGVLVEVVQVLALVLAAQQGLLTQEVVEVEVVAA
jgi:hypothetical protein